MRQYLEEDEKNENKNLNSYLSYRKKLTHIIYHNIQINKYTYINILKLKSYIY